MAEGPPAELHPDRTRYRIAYTSNGERRRARDRRPDDAPPPADRGALERGERLENLRVARPTLEDVYLELTAEE